MARARPGERDDNTVRDREPPSIVAERLPVTTEGASENEGGRTDCGRTGIL